MADTLVRPFTAFSFKQYLNEKKLMASRCTICDALHLPPRAVCPDCMGIEMEWVETSGRGSLAGFTAIAIGPTFMNNLGFGRDNPYLTGIVELEEGVKVSTRLSGLDAKKPGEVQIGQKMVVDFLERGDGTVDLGFRPE